MCFFVNSSCTLNRLISRLYLAVDSDARSTSPSTKCTAEFFNECYFSSSVNSNLNRADETKQTSQQPGPSVNETEWYAHSEDNVFVNILADHNKLCPQSQENIYSYATRDDVCSEVQRTPVRDQVHPTSCREDDADRRNKVRTDQTSVPFKNDSAEEGPVSEVLEQGASSPKNQQMKEILVHQVLEQEASSPKNQQDGDSPVYQVLEQGASSPKNQQAKESPVYQVLEQGASSPKNQQAGDSPVYQVLEHGGSSPKNEQAKESPVYQVLEQGANSSKNQQAGESPVYQVLEEEVNDHKNHEAGECYVYQSLQKEPNTYEDHDAGECFVYQALIH